MRRMETVRSMSWQESAGFISMEYAYLYPPGNSADRSGGTNH